MTSLGPRDPEGYYVIVLDKSCYNRIKQYLSGLDIMDLGDEVIVRTKSRSRGYVVLRLKKRYCH